MRSFSIFYTVIYFSVSRIFPGYIVLLLLAVSGCNKKKEIIPELRIAKIVPGKYINAADSGFVNQQDTVYYQNKYFTGYRFLLYHPGDTAFVQSYFNGVEESYQRKWYANRQIAEERFYINGKKEGIHKGWWPDGKEKFVFEAINNEYEGEFKEWYASGVLAKQFHYVNGQEEGSERLWGDNGTVRANYVIRNGKKYGLIGLKTCANPYDSVIAK